MKKNKKALATKKAKLTLAKGKCRFAKTIAINKSKLGKSRTLRLGLRFGGNKALKAGSTNKTLIVKD